MGFIGRLFGRASQPTRDPDRVTSDPQSASGPMPTRVGTSGRTLNDDLWLFLGHTTKKAIPAGSALPAKTTVVVTNGDDQPKRLVLLVLSGACGQAPPKSLLLPTAIIAPSKPEWRLEMQVGVQLSLDSNGTLSVHATDVKTGHPLPVTLSPPPAQCAAPWEIDGFRPNLVEWEEWLAKRYEFVIDDRFEVMETLATGGFGVIYLVTDRHTAKPKRIHLLKALRDDLSHDPNLRVKFASELALWKRLGTHPNIVGLDYVHESNGRAYGSMDWLVNREVSHRATTLSEYLRPGLALEVTAKWALDFCHGMQHARSRGMRAHLDIKPDNLFIEHSQNLLKIADFGLAVDDEAAFGRLADSGTIPTDIEVPDDAAERQCSILNRSAGVVCGTPGYMAPEVWEGKIAWERSDVYSFGVVLWQMCMGTSKLPYAWPARGRLSERLGAVYAQQKKGVFPRVPGTLSEIVGRCLASDPGARFASFDEVEQAIRATATISELAVAPEKFPMKHLSGPEGMRLDYERYCGTAAVPIAFEDWVQREYQEYRQSTSTPLRYEMWAKYHQSKGWE